MTPFERQESGLTGSISLDSGDPTATGDFCKIETLASTTFTTLTDTLEQAGGAGAATLTYPAGTVLRGKFTTITLSTGSVRVTLSAPLR